MKLSFQGDLAPLQTGLSYLAPVLDVQQDPTGTVICVQQGGNRFIHFCFKRWLYHYLCYSKRLFPCAGVALRYAARGKNCDFPIGRA